MDSQKNQINVTQGLLPTKNCHSFLFVRRDLVYTQTYVVAFSFRLFKPGNLIPPFFPEDIQRTDGRAWEALKISISEGKYTDEVKIVANLKRPLAVVHGDKDELVSLSYIKGLSIPPCDEARSRLSMRRGTHPSGNSRSSLTLC